MVLRHKVFFSKRTSATRSAPEGHDHLKWVPTSSTLVYGEKDAVLVDTQLTIKAAKELTDWVVASGKNLVAVYVTHAHGDHHFGCSTVLDQFPKAKVLATSEVAARMEKEHSPDRLQGLWGKLFPGQIPTKFASAEALEADGFELEGEALLIVRLGHTDCDETTALWVPSIRLLVAGDSVYGNTHPYMRESGSLDSRLEWLRALDKLAALKPVTVIGGHSDPDSSFGPEAIMETRKYFEDFHQAVKESDTAEEVYSRLMAKYPTRLNPGSLWGGAVLAKKN